MLQGLFITVTPSMPFYLPRVDMMYELFQDQTVLIDAILGSAAWQETHGRSAFCQTKLAELEHAICKAFSVSNASGNPKYFFEAIPEFVRSITALQSRWFQDFKRHVQSLAVAKAAVCICHE